MIRWLCLPWLCIHLLSCATAFAADPLYRQSPFDELKLDETNNNAVLKVKPLNLPERKVPTPGARRGDLEIELVDRPGEKFTVPWANVVDVKLFEERVLAEGEQLAAAGKFDDAHASFRFLESTHPQLPGLREAVENFLWLQVGGSFRAGKHDETLALLVELQRRSPNRPGLSNAFERTTTELVKARLAAKNYRGARGLLNNLIKRFPESGSATAAPFQQQMQTLAQQLLAQAQAAFGEQRWSDAHSACSQALDVWPTIDGGATLSQQIHDRYPVVTVGVLGAPAATAPTKFTSAAVMSDWHTRRLGRLIATPLVELVEGEKGSVFRSPYGKLVQQSDARQLILRLSAPAEGASPTMTAADLARRAQPESVATMISGIRPRTLTELLIEFREPQFRPAGWLQLCPQRGGSAPESAAVWGQFISENPAPDRLTLRRRAEVPAASAAPQLIFERRFPDIGQALAALRRGQIVALDRVPPWELGRVRGISDLRLQSYAIPTVHMLVPNPSKPLTGNRTFRRGLLSALDREGILKQGLCADQTVAGCEVISGPFPKNSERAWGYACDPDIKPRAYEPGLAAWLFEWSRAEVKKATGNDVPAGTPLILAHDDSPVARIACQSIAKQLARVGHPITLQPVASGQLAVEQLQTADLVYLELAITEPLVDAWLLLGPGGLSGNCSPLMLEHFRALERAIDQATASQHLHAIHRSVATDFSVLPLWQTTNHLVTHNSLQGVAEQPVTLYEDVLQWQSAWRPPQE